jgi:ribosomal protein S12 methylthiotransferase accessory factor
MELLRISRYARIIPAGPDCIYWMTETKQGYWSSPHLSKTVSLLASPRRADEVLDQFAETERDCAARNLDQMIQRGLLESASSSEPLAQLLREWGIAPQQLERKRWTEGVTLLNLDGPAQADALRLAFSALSVPTVEGRGLHLVLAADYLDPRIERLGGEYHAAGSAWALAKLSGEEIWAGPVFMPGRTACWQCLQPRLRENSWLRSQLMPRGGALFESFAPESRLRAGAEFAAQEIARWLLEAPVSIENAVWSFSWASLRSRRHSVIRRTDCPACQPSPASGSPAPIQLESVTVAWAPPADLRVASAQQIIDRLDPFASPITGIIRRLERRDLTPSPLVFTYGAVYNAALPPTGLRIPGAILQPGICSGRGLTADAAKAACLAEAVERYSAQFRGDENRVTARYCDLGENAIHLEGLLLFSERQYADRERWNRAHGLDEAVPEPFDETEEIEWVRGWSLTAQVPRLLPMALCFQYYRPGGKRWIGDADSSGCAAGSRREEATLCGLLELVERDALAIWWFNRIQRPAFSACAIPDPVSRMVCAQLEAQGWDVWLLDITTDLAIPVFAALASREGKWIRASSCHLHTAVAIRQAVCELWQLSKAASRPGSPPSSASRDESPLGVESCEARNADLRSLIEECCAKLIRAGHEVVVFDLTRAEIAFPVVRVVAPGLRSSKPRFGAGRLYQVPVRLGWIERARNEDRFPTQSA